MGRGGSPWASRPAWNHCGSLLREEENKDLPSRLTLVYSIFLRAPSRPSPVQNAMVVVDKFAIIRLDSSGERSPGSEEVKKLIAAFTRSPLHAAAMDGATATATVVTARSI
jgi:hypothetical protein